MRRVTGKFFVRQVRIVHDRPGRLDNINSLSSVAAGELGTPDRGIQGACEINPGKWLNVREI